MNRIYAISKSGALWIDCNKSNEIIATLLKIGFRECSREEYRAKRLEQQKEERKEERKMLRNFK